MTPASDILQVWLPRFGMSLAHPAVAREVRFAMSEWDHEACVWMVPRLKQPVRWSEAGERRLAVPATFWECAKVVHISQHGYVSDPLPDEDRRVPFPTVSDLLNTALAVVHTPITWWSPRPRLRTEVPRFRRGQFIGYHRRDFPLRTAGVLQGVLGRYRRGHKLRIHLSPPQLAAPPISPEAEAGHSTVAPYAAPEVRWAPNRSRRVIPVWPEVLRPLFPQVGRIDDVLEWEAFRAVIARPMKEEALRQAEAACARFSFPGWTSNELAWFRTSLAQFPDDWGALSGTLEDALRLPACRTLQGALSDEHWRKRMSERIRVPVVWGAMGLLWQVLLFHLRPSHIRHCRGCSQPFIGRPDKQWCERPLCKRTRARQRQQRSRQKRNGSRS